MCSPGTDRTYGTQVHDIDSSTKLIVQNIILAMKTKKIVLIWSGRYVGKVQFLCHIATPSAIDE